MDVKHISKMLSRFAIFIIIIIIVLSAFVANLLNIVNDHYNYNDNSLIPKRKYEPKADNTIVIDHQLKHTFWFLQITDIHLSKYFDPKRGPDLRRFCTETINIINPNVVIVTGDITDSRSKDPMGSQQHQDEWIHYYKIIHDTGVINRTKWFDMRGNHDTFNVESWDSDTNYYRKYSIEGPHHSHYSYTLNHESEKYTFIGVDACPTVGPKRPFNFIGVLSENDIKEIELMKQKSIDSKSNLTIWFGHYPTSSIAVPNHGIREIINGPYLCGHFHSIGGLVQQMYSTQPNGYLEIELGDWKDNRKLRIASVDHGIFSFNDFTFDNWPVILITNPKASLYAMPEYEEYGRIAKSTHIRVLVFSKSNITSVEFKINNDNWAVMEHVSGPLYVHKWDPNKYLNNLQWIHVKAKDSQLNERTVKHQFSLDRSKPEFSFGARLMIRGHIQTLCYWFFAISVSLCIFPLITFRLIHSFNRGESIYSKCEDSILRRLIFKLHLLSNINKIMIPLITIPIWAAFGPWLVGYVIDGHIGIIFGWGMYVNGTYLAGGFTYILGSLMLLVFHFPMTFCLAHIIYCRHKQLSTEEKCSNFKSMYIHFRHFIWCFFIIGHILFSLIYFFAYGFVAYILGFLNTWSFIIYIILWQFSLRLSPMSFPETIRPKNAKRDDYVNIDDSLLMRT